MKKQILFCAAFLAAISMDAQDTNPVVIVSASGKVALCSKDCTKTQQVQPGAVVNKSGSLRLGKGASAVVYCEGQFKELKGQTNVDLLTACGKASGTRKVDADYDFGEKLRAAVEMVGVANARGDGWVSGVTDPQKKSGDGWSNAVTDPQKKSGDGWGNAVTDPQKKSGDGWGNAVTDPQKKSGDGWGNAVTDPQKKSGDGWGGKGSTIRLIMPFGKLSAAPTTFNWSRPANTEPYQLTILDEAGKILHTSTVRDTFLKLDLASLNLVPERIYTWKISVSGIRPMNSNELQFGVGKEAERLEVLKHANRSALSNQPKNTTLRTLVEAIALEKDEWYYAAAQSYAGLQKRSSDNLVRMMHSAFWMRYGHRHLAEKAIKG